MDVVDLVKLGENLFEQDDIKGSRSKFLEALILAPEDPQLHNRLGMLEMSQGNSKKAQVYYTKACELAPEISRYHMRLGDSFQRLGQFEEAIQSYARSLELEPKNAPAWNNRGFANFNINRWNEALRCYDESMRSDPSYAVAWYNYGYTLQLSGRLNDSKDYYQKAVELDPEDKIAWNNLANVHYNQGQYERSIEIYKKSLELDPEYVIAVNNIGNALDHLHRYEDSIPYHEKAIELDSTFHYAWMAKGRALTRLGRPEEGLEFIETSIELESEDPDYHEALGRCFQSLGHFTKAREIINLGLSVDGQHVPCWVALGDVNMEINNVIRAMQCYDESVRAQDVLSRNRMRDLDWIEKGRILQVAGVIHEGFRQYSNAIAVAPGTGRPYFHYAQVLIDYDKKSEAQDLIKKGLERDPDSITGQVLLVNTMSGKELLDNLESSVFPKEKTEILKTAIGEKLVEINPEMALSYFDKNDSKIFLSISQCYTKLGDFNTALIFANKYVDVNPRDIYGFLAVAWIFFDLKDYKSTIDYFDMVLGIDPFLPDALFGKGLVLKALGRSYDLQQKLLSEMGEELVI